MPKGSFEKSCSAPLSLSVDSALRRDEFTLFTFPRTIISEIGNVTSQIDAYATAYFIPCVLTRPLEGLVRDTRGFFFSSEVTISIRPFSSRPRHARRSRRSVYQREGKASRHEPMQNESGIRSSGRIHRA